LSYTDAVEKFLKNYKEEDFRLVSLTYNYWSKLLFHLTSKAKKEETLVELKNVIQTSKSMNVLNTAVKEIDLLKKELEKMQEQKNGLMQVLLTGKKRLKI